MNSVMGIGEKIMFLYQGEKLWEGTKDDITHSGVKELDDFVFANKVMISMRDKL
jgi:phospholipid/cholesterol/gamma-HCH transport system ATP-binding protein